MESLIRLLKKQLEMKAWLWKAWTRLKQVASKWGLSHRRKKWIQHRRARWDKQSHNSCRWISKLRIISLLPTWAAYILHKINQLLRVVRHQKVLQAGPNLVTECTSSIQLISWTASILRVKVSSFYLLSRIKSEFNLNSKLLRSINHSFLSISFYFFI